MRRSTATCIAVGVWCFWYTFAPLAIHWCMYDGVTDAESCLLTLPTFDRHRVLPRLARACSSFPLIGRVSEPSIIHIHHLQQSSQFHQDTDGNHHIAHSIFEHTHFRPIQTAASVHEPSGTPAKSSIQTQRPILRVRFPARFRISSLPSHFADIDPPTRERPSAHHVLVDI